MTERDLGSLAREVVEAFAAGDCSAIDALLAARAEGTLDAAGANTLARHLASCATCREVAATISPAADRGGDHAELPEVDPAAYELGLEVGRGGMGRVLAARDLRVGRPVAVKELLGKGLEVRFEREAKVTARLQHPGIVPIYEIGRWPDGTPFYTMRMVEGRSLADAIAAAASRAERLALLPSVIAAADAVAFAHAQRVIHRDLTPSNILVGAYGETVVIDWGLARDLNDDDEEVDGDRLTGAGAVIGTATYMPPEQAHAVPVDERADVYALGAILYHLLAGVAPYRAKSTRELLRAVRTGPPDALPAGIPRELRSIVDKAMARDPDARYPSAKELAEELRRFQTGRLVEAHAYGRAERIYRFVRRHKAAALVAAAAVVLIGVAMSRVVASRAEARRTARELMIEEGRVEQVGGQPLRALAYLWEAYRQGARSPVLGFLINSALDELPGAEQLLDCGGDVRFIAFSPDGARMVGACHDIARVWRVADAAQVLTLSGVPAGFDRVEFSKDGRLLVSFGDAHVARVWDASSGAVVGVFDHGAGIDVAELTPDDRRLVTLGQDGKAVVWDVATGAKERTIVAKDSGLLYIYGHLSADGSRLFTLSMEGDGKGWDLATGALLGGFQHGGGALLLGADISRDGTKVVTCGNDRLSKVWDTKTGAPLLTLGGHASVVWKCVFSPDGARLMTASHDGRAVIWDLATGATITSVEHGDVVLWARFSPDGRRFLTGGVDGFVKVWDASSGAAVASHDTVGGKDAHFSPDGGLLVAQRGDGRIQVWKESAPTSFVPAGPVRALSADGTRAAVQVEPDGGIRLFDTARGQRVGEAVVKEPIALSADGTSLAGAADGGVVIVDTATGVVRRRIARSGPVSLGADGSLVAVGGEVWDARAAAHAAPLAAFDATHAVLDRTGARVLAWRDGSAPAVFDVASGARVAVLPVTGTFDVVGFSGDGTRVALVAGGTKVTLWNALTGAQLLETTDESVAPTFDPTGANLTTIGPDRVLTVWSAADGGVRATFVLDQLLQAQANADASLVAGIGDNGASVVVMSADGRVLRRTPIEHAAPAVTPISFHAAPARVWWSPDGHAIVAQAAGVTVMPVATQIGAGVGERIARAVPWRIEGGRLVWIDKVPLRGRVLRGGQPVEGAEVTLEYRMPPRHGSAPVGVDTMSMKVETKAAMTDEAGAFVLPRKVPPGRYAITVRAGSATRVMDADVAIDHGDLAIELAP